jgi:chromosome transmission fidelity protein 1
LCAHKLESINLFPILRYLHDSRLSQKLMGFMDPKTKTTTKQSTKQSNTHLEDPILPVVDASATAATVSSSLPSHISPMSIVETFLEKLNTYDPTHAKLVVIPHESLELVVLNPSVHAQDDLYSKPHALCLVGGTLQPFSVLVQELVPQLSHHASQAQAHILNYQQQKQQQGRATDYNNLNNKTPTSACYKSEQLIGFSCGHVVDKDHVLLQYLAHVNSTKLDLVHASRSLPHILHAIGSAIFSICQTIPYGGIVIFVPSYSYEQVLVEAWQRLTMNRDGTHVGPPPPGDLGMTTTTTTTTSIWNAINQVKRIFREPKNRNHLEATLREFSHEAQSPTGGGGGGGGGGALLIAVVGGKLSEGINFANDLCRCVVMVGLPYADKSDPILQEKLRYIPNPQQYYQSLCLRAVNQSVGRAIRHAKDYAAIVVMDPRYARDDAIAHGLPQWLTASTPSWRSQDGRLETVTQNLTRFFQNPKFQREHPPDG